MNTDPLLALCLLLSKILFAAALAVCVGYGVVDLLRDRRARRLQRQADHWTGGDRNA